MSILKRGTMNADEYAKRIITLVIDNDEMTYNRVSDAAMNAVERELGFMQTSGDDYADILRSRLYEAHNAVGTAVVEEIQAVIEETTEPGSPAADLAHELVNGMELQLGAYYLPSLEDYREWADAMTMD